MKSVLSDVNFALVGCGRVSTRHVDAVRRVSGARLAAVCDPIAARASRWSTELGIPAYSNLEDMLSHERANIDVVSILTPSGLHAEHCLVAARAGKHVLVEKPMALKLSDADRMIAACARAGVQLFVTKQVRSSWPIQALRAAIDQGRFGKLVLASARVHWTRTQAYYDQDAWRGTLALDGGVLANQASHYLDLLQWLMGNVRSVAAMTATRGVEIEAEDTAAGVLRFSSGALGFIEATTATRPRNLEGSLTILGEGGSAEVGGVTCNELTTWSFSNEAPGDDSVVARSRLVPPPGHESVIQNVVRSLRDGDTPLVDGIEGRKSLELIVALYQAAATSKEVHLPCAAGQNADR